MEFLTSNPQNPRGEPITGLDRFGRVTGNAWKTSSTDLVDTRYGYDAAGNWKAFAVSVSSPLFSQTREHNAANEITEIDNPSGVEGVAYDEIGNTTACPTPASWTTQYVLKWDASARLGWRFGGRKESPRSLPSCKPGATGV